MCVAHVLFLCLSEGFAAECVWARRVDRAAAGRRLHAVVVLLMNRVDYAAVRAAPRSSCTKL